MHRAFLAADGGQPAAPTVGAALSRGMAVAWASPALRSHEGRQARLMLSQAAESLATSLGDPRARVVFLPGSTVALSAAVVGVGFGQGAVLTTPIDRQLVHRVADEHRGGVRPVAVDPSGQMDLAALDVALLPRSDHTTAPIGVVVAQVGNPEVGTRQPLDEIHRRCRAAGVPLLVDATMSIGREPPPAQWDALVVDASSWAGGVGVAAVVLRPGVAWRGPVDDPDVPELPLLAPSVPACAAAAVTLEQARAGVGDQAARDLTITAGLRSGLAEIPDVVVHGHDQACLPHVVGFSLLYIDAEALLLELDRRGIAVASGSACTARDGVPSHVLAALGTLTSGNVRVTLPLRTDGGMLPSEAAVERLLEVLPGVVADLRREAGL